MVYCPLIRLRSNSLLALLILPLLALQCEEDKPELSPLEQLPPATQTGEYTFGCLVNGEAAIPESTNHIFAIYQQGFLQFGADIKENGIDYNISLYLAENIETKTYQMTAKAPPLSVNARFTDSSNSRLDASGTNYIGVCRYEYEDLVEGTLTITHFDSVNYIISGTFEFVTAIDEENCDTMRITDGRFDIPYIP